MKIKELSLLGAVSSFYRNPIESDLFPLEHNPNYRKIPGASVLDRFQRVFDILANESDDYSSGYN